MGDMYSLNYIHSMSLIQIRLSVLLSLLTTSRGLDCPPNYVDSSSMGLGCIYPMKVPGYSWEQAAKACWEESQGHLVEIYDGGQQMYLVDLLESFADDGVDIWWIGATDLNSEVGWYWSYSQSICSYTFWGEGQPSGGLEHCAALETKDTLYYRWNDYVCNEPVPSVSHSVCQIYP